jgi:hypothetical protein
MIRTSTLKLEWAGFSAEMIISWRMFSSFDIHNKQVKQGSGFGVEVENVVTWDIVQR